MSFLDGFIATALDDEGNSDVVRISVPRHTQMLYSIDSERVSDLHIVQDDRQIRAATEVVGGKTLVRFPVKPDSCFAMIYRRLRFADHREGIWHYSDYWHISGDVLFMLMLPMFGVVRTLNARSLGRNRFDLDNRLVMSKLATSGDLHIRLQYAIDSEDYMADRPTALTSSSFPRVGTTALLEDLRSRSVQVRKGLHALATTVDWVAKGASIVKALEILHVL